MNSPFNFICNLSNFETTYAYQLMFHSLFSCLLPLTTIFISYDKSSQLETMQQYIMSHSHNLCLSYESHHKLNKPFIDIGAFMSTMNTLLSIFFYNFACHFESHIK